MMKKVYNPLIVLMTILLFFSSNTLAQIPDAFSYQAVARDASGNPIVNTNFDVRIAIQTNDAVPVVLWEEEHQVTSNSFGLFTVTLGIGGIKTDGTAVSFSEIDWVAQSLSIRTSIRESGGTWQQMDPSGLLSVPYALSAKDVETKQQISKSGNSIILSEGGQVDLTEFTDDLTVVSTDDASTDALFEVRRSDGQTVFAVYPNGVNVFVDDVGTKGPKGGFAIGGFDTEAKAPGQTFMLISPDSIRMFMPNNPAIKGPGSKGGFAIGGFDATKGTEELYFNVSGKATADTYESSPRILWYPLKEAFLAGRVHIGSPDSVGQNSTALGYHSIAMGDYSQAFGNSSKALSTNTTAIGYGAIARGLDSYAFGSGAVAEGEKSFAFGSVGLDDDGNPTQTPTLASGNYSVAFGMGAQSTSKGAMAFGVGASSSGFASNSIGYYSTASGNYSLAFGYRSTIGGFMASGFGPYANAQGNYSLSLGYSSDALQNYSVGIGYRSTANNSYAIAIGYESMATGVDSYAFGSGAWAAGERSFAIGSIGLDASGNPNTTPTKAIGNYSMAVGMGTQSHNLGSIAIGVNSLADNDYAVAIGNTATSSGTFATSLGYLTQANGDKSISIGAYYDYTFYRFVFNPLTGRFELDPITVQEANIANGDYSISFGNGNYSESGGLAIGTHNDAKAIGAVAIGHTNYADSAYSFAAGYSNYAKAMGAFAMGQNITVNSLHGFAVGRYNIDNGNQEEWIETDPIFMVGNGTSSSAKSNAFVVYKNGDALIDGDLTVTGNISASVTGDGMGTHTATQNLRMNGYWVSNDGGNEGIFVSTSGYVGINDNTPSYPLDVTGNGRILNNLYVNDNLYTSDRLEVTSSLDASGTTNSGSLEIGNSLRLDNNEIITNTGTTLFLQNDNDGDLQVDGTTLFVDADVNRVGIGNAAPSYKLDVAGAIRSTGDIIGATLNTSNWEIDNKNDISLGNIFGVSYGKTGVFGITQTGILLSQASFNTTVGVTNRGLFVDSNGVIGYKSSSKRYKKEINSLDDINWIYDLRPVTYKYKSDASGRTQFGLIAEEVEKVNPLFVSYNEEGIPETVLYSDFISPLLKAVQEQNRRSEQQSDILDEIKAENKELRYENNELRSRIEQLEMMVSTILEKQ